MSTTNERPRPSSWATEERVARLTELARKAPCWAHITGNVGAIHVDTSASAVLAVEMIDGEEQTFTLLDTCDDTEALERALYAMAGEVPKWATELADSWKLDAARLRSDRSTLGKIASDAVEGRANALLRAAKGGAR